MSSVKSLFSHSLFLLIVWEISHCDLMKSLIKTTSLFSHRIKVDWIMIIITLGGKLLNWIKSSLISPSTFPFTAVSMLMSGVGCEAVMWVDHTFFPRPVSSTQTRPNSICCSLSVYLFSLDVCFQTQMQHEIIQSGATESVCLPELLPERLKRERLNVLRDLHFCVRTNSARCTDS